MEKIRVELTKEYKEKPDSNGIPFGTYFTDHMFKMNFEKDLGWYDPRIVPYAPMALEPSTMVFHYAQEVFEGLKAYRGVDGKIRLFRPMENIKRMNMSCERMCIPPIPEDIFMEALITMVRIEKDWIPIEDGTSLYIRPFVIASDPFVGVRASHTYIFMIITCPVGSYYPTGMNPVKIVVETEDVRTVRGGTGFTKCGGNYAASIRAGDRAHENGYDQVLWLDGIHRKYIDEVGSMNVMFKIGGRIVTPELGGSVLPGVTRKSCIEILKSWGYEVEERLISITELIEAANSGALEEAWGTGTAAVISPIGEISYEGKRHEISGFKTGEITQKLYDCLTGIQWGKRVDSFGWGVEVF